ncbi:MAG: DinB family protein [Acidobacteria bacterium]|nr:DinB family protein [Acidobacteriota bacterium]
MIKKISLVLMCMLCLSTFALAGTPKPTSDPKMSKEERDKLIQALLDSQKELLAAIENLTEAQWNFRPAPFKWTVGETAEHIALAEGLLFAQVERALAAPANPDWEAKTANKMMLIEGPLAQRQGKAQAPEPIQPLKRHMSRAEILKLLKEGREKSLQFARSSNADMKSHTLDHPFPLFGTLNAYQWLIFIPMHNLRHNKQVVEIKANANFPK